MTASVDRITHLAPAGATPEPFALVGSVLGDTYQIDGVLGSGTHGVLYAARHMRLASKCAVKVVRVHGDPRLFHNALAGLSAVIHPHLNPPFDCLGLADGRVLLASHLLEGEDLHNRVALRGKLTAAEGMALCRQVVAGLLALHRRGLCHGNLNARNVFLARFDDVVIDGALGQGGGAEGVRLLDMGLSHCDGIAGSALDDQQALARLLLDHVADLSLPQRQVLEKAQVALAQKRYPSLVEFWQALESISLIERISKPQGQTQGQGQGQGRTASSATAVVSRKGGPPSTSSDEEEVAPPSKRHSGSTYVIPRGSAADTDPDRGADDGKKRGQRGQRAKGPGSVRLLLISAVALVCSGLAALGWHYMENQGPLNSGAISATASSSLAPPLAPAKSASAKVTLRFVLYPENTEVSIDGNKVPPSKIIQVDKGKKPLPLSASAKGHLAFTGTVTPDQDRTVDVALLAETPKTPSAEGDVEAARDGSSKDLPKKKRAKGRGK